MLEEYGLSDSKPALTPFKPNTKPSKYMELRVATEIKLPCREAVGGILYANQETRSDISFAANYVCYYTQNPKSAVKQIFRCLRGTWNIKLKFS